MTDATLAALAALDTPTVCNALELVVSGRRGFGYTTRPLFCAWPAMGSIVGYARTATLRALRPATMPAADVRARRLDYYRHVAGAPGPTVTVIEDLDDEPGYGAFWGEVNTNIHKGLGVRGVVTNGSIRDLPQCAEGFQLLAGSVGPSHAFAHIVDVGLPVTVAGMSVRPGDLIHADRHGAVVIPPAAAAQIAAAAALIARREAVIIAASRQPGFTVEVLAQAMAEADDIH